MFALSFYVIVGVFGLISLCEETPEIFLLRPKLSERTDFLMNVGIGLATGCLFFGIVIRMKIFTEFLEICSKDYWDFLRNNLMSLDLGKSKLIEEPAGDVEEIQGVEIRKVENNIFLEIELSDNNIVNIKNVFTVDPPCETQSTKS